MIIKVTCPQCYFAKDVLRETIPLNAKRAICPRCGKRFEFLASKQGHSPDALRQPEKTDAVFERKSTEKDARREGAPWENRAELGLWSSICQTLKSVLFSPEAHFRTLSFERGIREPMAFGLLIGSIGIMFGIFWQVLMLSKGISLLSDYFLGRYAVGVGFLFIMAMVPAAVTLVMFFVSGTLHCLLLAVRGGKNRFEATFRVVSYSQAAQAWGLVPIIGGCIGALWQLIIQVIGLREMHETSYFKVIIAFLPIGIFLLLWTIARIPFSMVLTQ